MEIRAAILGLLNAVEFAEKWRRRLLGVLYWPMKSLTGSETIQKLKIGTNGPRELATRKMTIVGDSVSTLTNIPERWFDNPFKTQRDQLRLRKFKCFERKGGTGRSQIDRSRTLTGR